MPENANSKVRAKVRLTPNQVDALRTACYETGASYLQQRNEMIIALTYDTGLRVGELVDVNVEMLQESNSELYLPDHIQKDYPNDDSPSPIPMELSGDVTRLVPSYLNSRWKESPALFPDDHLIGLAHKAFVICYTKLRRPRVSIRIASMVPEVMRET